LQERLGKNKEVSENQQNIIENTTKHSEEETKLYRQENIRTLKSSLDTLLPADNKPYKPLLDKLQTINPEKP